MNFVVPDCSLDEDSVEARLVVGWGSGNAIVLNSEVVSAHLHVEEAVVTPVGSPGVAANPVLLASVGVLAVTDDRDLVVDHWEEDLLRVDVVTLTLVDTVVGVLPVVSGMDSAGDGTVGSELGLHLVGTLDLVVLADVVLAVVNGVAVGKRILTLLGWWVGAVSADVDVLAHAVNKVVGSVLLARGVRNSVLTSVSVDETWVTTVAGAASLAVDNHLSIKANWSGAGVLVQDVESVSDGGGAEATTP